MRNTRTCLDVRRCEGQALLRAGRCRDPDREPLVDAEVPRPRAEALRRVAFALRLRASPAARRASPADADRGGTARTNARAVPALLDGRPDAGREPGRVPADPP